MGFLEILLLFVCFCLVSAGVDLLKDLTRAKLAKRTAGQVVDTVFASVIRSMMKYRLDAKTVFSKPESKTGGVDDEMSSL